MISIIMIAIIRITNNCIAIAKNKMHFLMAMYRINTCKGDARRFAARQCLD